MQSDPTPRWNELPSSEKSKSEPICFRQVLDFLMDEDFEDLNLFGAAGFMRYRGDGHDQQAYARKHVYSALLLNITLLHEKQVFFNRSLHIWEDLDFNLRADKAGVVLCKCYRFAQHKAQMKGGGCNEWIAAPEPSNEECELSAFLTKLGIAEAEDPAWVKDVFEDETLEGLQESAEGYTLVAKLQGDLRPSYDKLSKRQLRILAGGLLASNKKRRHGEVGSD